MKTADDVRFLTKLFAKLVVKNALNRGANRGVQLGSAPSRGRTPAGRHRPAQGAIHVCNVAKIDLAPEMAQRVNS